MDVRELILETAVIGFVEKGLDHISLNELIKRTGLTKGAFYYYFKNKEELIREINQRYLYSYIDSYVGQFDLDKGTVFDHLDFIVTTILNMISNSGNSMSGKLDSRLLYRLIEASCDRDEFLKNMSQERNARIKMTTRLVIENGIKKGYVNKSVDPIRLSNLIYAMVKGSVTDWVVEGTDLEEVLQSNMETLKELIRK